MSGTVYFSYIHRSFYQWVLFGSCAFLIVLKKSFITPSALFSVIPFVFLIILNTIFNSDDLNNDGFNMNVGYILRFVLCGLTPFCLDKSRFIKAYIYIMSLITTVSLICFFIQITFPFVPYLIAISSDFEDPYFYSLFHTWGWGGIIFQRNCGPFWEPGGFQGFLTMALLILLFEKSKLFKPSFKLFSFFLFVIGILTTGSSTAYILLGIILTAKFKTVVSTMSVLPAIFKYLFGITIILGSVLFIYKSNNIQEKLNGKNESASIRQNDLLGGLEISTSSPIIGLGPTHTRDQLKETYKVAKDDSAGLTNMAYQYGYPFLIIYLIWAFKGLCAFFGNKNIRIIYPIFIIMSLTEGLWILPFYIYIVFYRNNKNIKHLKIDTTKY